MTIVDLDYWKADAVIMVYDCCDQESFSSIDKWYGEVHRYLADKLDNNMPVIMVANKIDKLKEAKKEGTNTIDFEVSEKKASGLGCICMETSAKTGHNVHKLFQTVAELLVAQQVTLHQEVCTSFQVSVDMYVNVYVVILHQINQ